MLIKSGVQLGVCEEDSAESRQLASDYLSALQAIKEEQLSGGGQSWAEVKLLCPPFSPPFPLTPSETTQLSLFLRFCLFWNPTALCISSSSPSWSCPRPSADSRSLLRYVTFAALSPSGCYCQTPNVRPPVPCSPPCISGSLGFQQQNGLKHITEEVSRDQKAPHQLKKISETGQVNA